MLTQEYADGPGGVVQTAASADTLADELADELVGRGFGPFFQTPCGVLAPLCTAVEARAGLLVVPREDTMVGMAAGAALGGASPAVLMQNSGFGQSVNALASLVVPYRIPMLLVVSLRGLPPDTTAENAAMGRLTAPILTGLGMHHQRLEGRNGLRELVEQAATVVRDKREPAAVLVGPDAFGWSV